MVVYKGIQCSLHAASRQLDEYEDTTNNNPECIATTNNADVITRYIDIDKIEGQNFSIEVNLLPEFKWDNNDPRFRVVCDCYADGQPIIPPTDIFSEANQAKSIYGSVASVQKVNGTYFDFVKKMYFSPVKIVKSQQDANIKLTDQNGLDSLGKIQVKVWRARLRNGKALPEEDFKDPHSEKAGAMGNGNMVVVNKDVIKKKGTSHRVCFKKPKADHKTRVCAIDWNNAKLMVTFIFLYRTHNYLDNQGIIPYVPFHCGNGNDSDLSDMDVEDD